MDTKRTDTQTNADGARPPFLDIRLSNATKNGRQAVLIHMVDHRMGRQNVGVKTTENIASISDIVQVFNCLECPTFDTSRPFSAPYTSNSTVMTYDNYMQNHFNNVSTSPSVLEDISQPFVVKIQPTYDSDLVTYF